MRCWAAGDVGAMQSRRLVRKKEEIEGREGG